MTQNKTTEEKIKEIQEDILHLSDEEWEKKYGNKKYWDVYLALILKEREEAKREIIERVEKEVIGERFVPKIKTSYPELGKLAIDLNSFNQAIALNKIKAEMLTKLNQMKEEK